MTTQLNKRNKLVQGDLAQFRGTEQYWRTGVPWHPFLYTDGVQHVAEHGEAYWILDLVGSWQGEPQVKHDPMLQDIQFWILTVNENQSAVMRCERDRNDVVVRQEIAYTDFPLPEIRFYLSHMWCFWKYSREKGPRRTEDYGVLLLPSEY